MKDVVTDLGARNLVKNISGTVPRLSPFSFLFSESGKFYLFTAKTRTYARINNDLYNLLQECDGTKTIDQIIHKYKLNQDAFELFDNLYQHQVIIPKYDESSKEISDLEIFNTINSDRSYFNHLTVFPTYKCNLACKYCYARGGDNPITVDFDLVAIFFDWFNQLPHSEKVVSMSFHGGGEPTMAYSMIKKISRDFRKRCDLLGLDSNISMVSNGAFSKAVCEWLLKENISVNFSVDGPPDIQDTQRSFRSGKSTSSIVYNNIRKFIDSGRDVAVRVTVTDRSVSDMLRITQFFIEMGVSSIQIEPCFFVGRCEETGYNEPNATLFVEMFHKCFIMGLEHDVDVTYSGLRSTERARDRFCGACGASIALTPNGFLTACYEVVSPDDPAADVFMIGKVNENLRTVELDEDRIQYLKTRSVKNLFMCKSCFLQYNCAGDCPVKAFRDTGSIFKTSTNRCEVAIKVNQKIIMQIADEEIVPRNTVDTSKYTFGDCPK